MRFGVKRIESDKGTPDVPQAGGRVIFHLPFDERRRDAVERQAAIGGDGDQPIQWPAAHRFDTAQGIRGGRCGGANIVGSADPCCQSRHQIRRLPVELEPARPIGARGSRIYRNDFQIEAIAEPEKAIVSSHSHMFPAGLRRNSQNVADILCAGLQRWRRDNQVIDLRVQGGEGCHRSAGCVNAMQGVVI